MNKLARTLSLAAGLTMAGAAMAADIATPKADAELVNADVDAQKIIQATKSQVSDWPKFCALENEKKKEIMADSAKPLVRSRDVAAPSISRSMVPGLAYFKTACQETGN